MGSPVSTPLVCRWDRAPVAEDETPLHSNRWGFAFLTRCGQRRVDSRHYSWPQASASPGLVNHLWRCSGPNTCAYSSPCFGDGLIYLTENGPRNIGLGIVSLTIRPVR